MIFAFIFYIAALVVTLLWFFKERREHNNAEASNSASSPEESQGLVSATSRPVILPDGRHGLEREYLDEKGQKVKEVTIEDV